MSMVVQPPDPKELGRYYALAQIGMEMVTPLAVGIGLDYFFESAPWLSIIGAVIGLVGGMAHLVVIVNQKVKTNSAKSRLEDK